MASLMSLVLGHEEPKKMFLRMTEQKNFFSGVLLAGPEGIGKKKLAIALLQELNCQQARACGVCESCQKVIKSPDVFLHLIELQNDKIKIEQVRDIIHFTSLKSWVKHRFVLINQVEKITPQAANALLKSLEEPPEGVHFVFTTSNLSQVLTTLRSRCQVVSFSPLPQDILSALVPGLEPWQLRWSFGRLSLAQKIGQEDWVEVRKAAINFLHNSQNTKVYDALLSCLTDAEKVEFVMHCWMTYLRDAFLLSQGCSEALYNIDIASFAEKFSQREKLSHLFEHFSQWQQDYYAHVDKNLLLENLSIQLGTPNV